MVGNKDPKMTNPCDKYRQETLRLRTSEARTWVTNAARSFVDFLTRPTKSPARDVVTKAMQEHFGLTSKSDPTARQAEARLQEVITKIQSRFSSPFYSECSNRDAGPAAAEINSERSKQLNGNYIIYHNLFWNLTKVGSREVIKRRRAQSRAIVHEVAHLSIGSGIDVYGHKDAYPGDPMTALRNADSYAWFIHDVATNRISRKQDRLAELAEEE